MTRFYTFSRTFTNRLRCSAFFCSSAHSPCSLLVLLCVWDASARDKRRRTLSLVLPRVGTQPPLRSRSSRWSLARVSPRSVRASFISFAFFSAASAVRRSHAEREECGMVERRTLTLLLLLLLAAVAGRSSASAALSPPQRSAAFPVLAPPRPPLLCRVMLAMTSTGQPASGDIADAGEWLRQLEAVEGAVADCANQINDAQIRGIGNRQKRVIGKKGERRGAGTQGRDRGRGPASGGAAAERRSIGRLDSACHPAHSSRLACRCSSVHLLQLPTAATPLRASSAVSTTWNEIP